MLFVTTKNRTAITSTLLFGFAVLSILLIFATSAAHAEQSTTTYAFSCADVSQLPRAECDGLVSLYDSTKGSTHWTNRSGWKSTNTPCSWYGITCVSGHVTKIQLPSNNLDGQIPAGFGSDDLPKLALIEVQFNNLSGPIPASMGTFSELYELSLYYNALEGTIPSELGNLTDLTGFRLGHNQLVGAIPSSLGNLTKVEAFGVDDNKLTGAIPPSLGNLTKVEILNMDKNMLTGSIPTTFNNFPNVWRLWLEQNQLEGTIPAGLGNMTNLTNLSVAENALSGNIPTSLQNLTKIRNLRLANNRLTASNAALRNFLDSKAAGWDDKQTVPPTNMQVNTLSSSSVRITWSPIAYTGNGGYYEVRSSTTSGGPYSVRGVTSNKSASSFTVTGLAPNTTHYFIVRTFTPAHGTQQNALWSSYSQEVSATTDPDTSQTAPDFISTPVTTGTVGAAYAYSPNANGTAPLFYELLTSPSGMTINSGTGLISWTPSATGQFPVQVKVSNSVGNDTQPFTITVNKRPEISSSPITGAVINQAYAYDVDASGLPAPTYSLFDSPSGMSINATSGLINWTPSATGVFSATVQAQNVAGLATQSFSINVQDATNTTAPVIGTTPVTEAVVNRPYSYNVDAVGNPAPTFSLTTAPSGMTINATTGLISWTPSTTGNVSVTVRAQNGAGTDEQSFTIAVTATPTGDDYEDDDLCGRATVIATTGAEQSHNHHDVGDQDWIKFTAQANRTYVITVKNAGANADTVVFLHNSCDQDATANGNNSFGSTVTLEWDAIRNGDHYLQLQHLDPVFSGTGTGYLVSVEADNVPPSTPKSPRCRSVNATTLGIQWQENPERDVRGYRIAFTGGVSGNEDVDGNATTYYELGGLIPNQVTKFRVTAVDYSGNESAPTGEVQCVAEDPSDSTTPSMVLSQPGGDNIRTTSGDSQTFSGIASDAGGNLSRIHVRNQTTNAEAWDYSLSGANDDFRVADVPLAIGDNDVEFDLYDDAGNITNQAVTVRRLGDSPGAVILVAGHNDTFSLQSNIYNSANRAYRIFQSAGYADDDIYYIAPVAQDANGDGEDDVDATASPSALQGALTAWAKEEGRVGAGRPLFLYMMDHGFADKFCVSGCSGGGEVTPAEVDGWLRDLEGTTGLDQATVVIEACQSGSFLDRHNGDVVNSLSKSGRVIITSTGRVNNAYASAQGAYFSDAFFSCLSDSNNLKVCFEQGASAVLATGVNQTPWIDDNGDGLFNDSDGTVAAQRVVTRFFSSTRPRITGADVTRSGVNGLLTAKVEDGIEETDIVWAAIYPPDFEEPDDVTLNLNVPTVRLEPVSNTPGEYSFNYLNGFTEEGDYRIVFYAQDRLGIHAEPRVPGQVDGVYLPIVHAP